MGVDQTQRWSQRGFGLVENVAGSGGTGQDQGLRISIIQRRMDAAGAAPRLVLRCFVAQQQSSFNGGLGNTDSRCFCSNERGG
jgi:hypothetical protein